MDKLSSSVTHLMFEDRQFPPPPAFAAQAHLNSLAQYNEMYRFSIENPDVFWLQQCPALDWFKPPTKGCNYIWNSEKKDIRHTWFEDGLINVSYNCLDRHVIGKNRHKTAIVWQGDHDSETRSLTFNDLYEEVCRFSNVLKSRGISKGDRVCIYMPMVPELAIAMLACARIGAIHSVVFGGFSAESFSHRIKTHHANCSSPQIPPCGPAKK